VEKFDGGEAGIDQLPFHQVWAVDFEFTAPPGERPKPICLVAREMRTGKIVRVWQDELLRMNKPPYPTDSSALFVAYFASAELGCHLALGWSMPERILDLFVEHRASTNGLAVPAGNSLLGALAANGLEGITTEAKTDMRDLILTGGPWTITERSSILDYCQTDVDALGRLLPAMMPRIDLPRALLRGRYMATVSQMEHSGVPIDLPTLDRLRGGWESIKTRLVERIDAKYGVFDGTTFKRDRFAHYLAANSIGWPRLPSGQFNLNDVTFRDRARAYPDLEPLRNLRHALSQMRLADLSVGADMRNRCLLSPFRSRTGRNQPSNAKFIFGPSAWLRSLIRPPKGHGLAYIDYTSQEIGIAAALSGDPLLIKAYNSGDPYLTFAKQVGAVPEDATKASHKPMRDRFKSVVLGVNYGMAEHSLAASIGSPVIEARQLLQLHRETYREFWRWSQAVVDTAMLRNRLETVFGWPLHIGRETSPRSLMNFPMQANGAEILRLACSMVTEAGIEVCAPVHDAILICAPLEQLDDHVTQARKIMAEAGRIVLNGFELGTDAELVRWPDRYLDGRGLVMWQTVMELLGKLEREAA
jgi:DNA polymerase I